MDAPPVEDLAQQLNETTLEASGEDVAPEEPTIESPKALTWRRNKLSDKERYEDDFYFEINGKRMVINQDVANELDTVGLTVWDSSLVMMKYLEKLHNQGRFGRGMKVLELGSGCAPVSIAAGMLGAQVTATDVEWILVFTKRNSELNRKLIEEGGGSVECRTLYWGREADMEGLPHFDFIIAADCIYKEKQVVTLLKTMHQLADEKTKILVGYEQHNPESAHAFYVHVNQYFDTESVCIPHSHINNIPLSQHDGYYQHPKIKLMWLTKKEFTPPPTISEDTNWVSATATASKKEQQQA